MSRRSASEAACNPPGASYLLRVHKRSRNLREEVGEKDILPGGNRSFRHEGKGKTPRDLLSTDRQGMKGPGRGEGSTRWWGPFGKGGAGQGAVRRRSTARVGGPAPGPARRPRPVRAGGRPPRRRGDRGDVGSADERLGLLGIRRGAAGEHGAQGAARGAAGGLTLRARSISCVRCPTRGDLGPPCARSTVERQGRNEARSRASAATGARCAGHRHVRAARAGSDVSRSVSLWPGATRPRRRQFCGISPTRGYAR